MKRAFDFVASLGATIALSPFLGAIALIILLTDGKPIFFRQDRIGKNEQIFKIYKFRTMKVGAPNMASRELKNKSAYLTKMGKWLRKTSMDELPQLFNIVKGEMSFVGPRPLIPEEEDIHLLRQKAGVYRVRPGLTGWAQVNGRESVTIQQKVDLDREYAENSNIRFDMKILFRTILVVLHRDGTAE